MNQSELQIDSSPHFRSRAGIRDVIGTGKEGTFLSDVARNIDELGYNGTAEFIQQGINVNTVKGALDNGSSVIVNLRTKVDGGAHAVVIDYIKNGRAYIIDPLPQGIGSAYSVPVNRLGSVLTGDGVILRPMSVIANVSKEGNQLVLRGMHIDGPGAGSSNLGQLRDVARALGREYGVREVVIYGGQRTTGANPGKIPRPIVIRVNP